MENKVNLTKKDFELIKSNSVDIWRECKRGETDVVEAVIDAFLMFCNRNKLVIREGNIYKEETNEKTSI